MPVRSADAVWDGDNKAGKGKMRLGGGAYEGPYSYSSRFEDGSGTNPEELIAAAHAGCFSMSLAGALTRAGHPPTTIRTTARIHLEWEENRFTIKRSELLTEAEAPGVDEGTFREAAEGAKANCPVSRALGAIEITLDAKLVGS